MRIVYPYNEILPTRKAHDVFLFQECASLAVAGCDVTLLSGKGSQNREALCKHYNAPQSESLHVVPLPIIRRNYALPISWNLPFFYFAEKHLRQIKPNVVITSVLKQGAYLFTRKRKPTRYVYEVHELKHYPTLPSNIAFEKSVLEKADLITVTTQRLKEILLKPPYSLRVPIHVIPLAVRVVPLPPPPEEEPLTLAYVGQLYKEQGVSLLLRALAKVREIRLLVVGGRKEEIALLKEEAAALKIDKRVSFLGFHPPAELPALLALCHAFVAPFEAVQRMPYVAHTKLLEYAAFGRPIIAPDLPVVLEHFPKSAGLIPFEPGNESALAEAIEILTYNRPRLQREIEESVDLFTWEKRAREYLRILA